MKLCDKISWIIWHQMQEEREKRECPFNYCTWYKNALLSRQQELSRKYWQAITVIAYHFCQIILRKEYPLNKLCSREISSQDLKISLSIIKLNLKL